jgi:hypothetical protein
MEEQQAGPSSEGRMTRSQARKRPSLSTQGGLKSPLLSDFYQPSRKQARTAAHVSLRQIRKRGGLGEGVTPELTGHLGTLPTEVSLRGSLPSRPDRGLDMSCL